MTLYSPGRDEAAPAGGCVMDKLTKAIIAAGKELEDERAWIVFEDVGNVEEDLGESEFVGVLKRHLEKLIPSKES